MENDAVPQLELERVFVDRVDRGRKLEVELFGIGRPHRASRQISEDEAFEDQLAEVGMCRRIPVAGQRLGGEEHHGP